MGVLSGKVVLVTGGGNGIGRECALIAAQAGAKVVVNDLGASLTGADAGSAGPAEAVAEEIREAGGEAIANSDSVTSLEAVRGMVAKAIDRFGALHGVINTAGILRDGMFHKMAEADWDKVIDVHLRGTFNVCRATIEHFRAQVTGPMCSTPPPLASSAISARLITARPRWASSVFHGSSPWRARPRACGAMPWRPWPGRA